jgi:hypothetical protein
VSFINLHLKGIYDNMIPHTADLSKNAKIKVLGELSQALNGDVFNIFFYEEINSLVEHLMGIFNRPRVTLSLANLSSHNKQVPVDSMDVILKHFMLVPANKVEDNPFLWEKPELIKLPKFPTKCLDNYSIINFPEEAHYIFSEAIMKLGTNLFFDVEFPTYPKYFIDTSHFWVTKKKLAIKGDVYNIENKGLLGRFKQLVASNPKLAEVKLPVYYYYQYEQNYQLVGLLKYKVFGKNDEFFKLEFKHYPLKFLQVNEVVTVQKAHMQKLMEKLIETLPRYSHNYYFSILRINNVTGLLKKRFKFMFGFSVGSAHPEQALPRTRGRLR